MEREPVIGIDLGTTNSVVAAAPAGEAEVIASRVGGHLTPSVVAVSPNGKRLVGVLAKRQAVTNAENTAYAVKRLIGRPFSSAPVQEAAAQMACRLVPGAHDDVRIRLAGRDLSVPEVAAMVLVELKADAEAHFGRPVRKAVVAVPAHFNDGQRQATKDAAAIAGLEVLRILNEPTAAALAYGFGRSVVGKIAVFDLGGGTFDVSVLQLSGGVFEVLATGGDTYLGGEDFDRRIIEWLCARFAQENGADLRQDKMALQRLREAAEKAKCELSGTREVQVNLPFIYTPRSGGSALHLQCSLTREKLEGLTVDLVERCIERTRATLAEAGVRAGDLREIILVGGMTRMPAVGEAVRRLFGREPCRGVHPEEVVALGAAIHAAALNDDSAGVVLLDVTPHALGVAIAGGYARPLVPKNTTVPTSATESFSTSRDDQTTVKIVVLQGESPLAAENELLGEFVLTGLRPALRGEVEVRVTFDISADGIVSVSAKDVVTGKRQSLTVTAGGGLTRDEVARIIIDGDEGAPEPGDREEARQRRVEIARLAADLEAVLPGIRELVSGRAVDREVLARAERQLEQARQALASEPGLGVLVVAQEGLSRTVDSLCGLVGRLGKGS